jgi:Ca2+-binding RTX toxin-like protein
MGQAGDDTLIGGAGSDEIHGGTGADIVQTVGAGSDWIYADLIDLVAKDKHDHLIWE